MSTQHKTMTRRHFLASTSAAAAFTIVPRHVLGGPGYVAPSDKLNIACIGVGGRGGAQVGGWMLARLTASWMLFLFSAFLLVMSTRLLIQALGLDLGLERRKLARRSPRPYRAGNRAGALHLPRYRARVLRRGDRG